MATKRKHPEAPEAMSQLELFEDAVYSKVATCLSRILSRLQSESSRLVEKARDQVQALADGDEKETFRLSLQDSESFDAMVDAFVLPPLGHLEVTSMVKVQRLEPPTEIETPSTEWSNESETVKTESSTEVSTSAPSFRNVVSPTEITKPVKTCPYSGCRVVKVFSGKDKMGDPILNPHGIIHLPDSNAFAFIHNRGRISLLSSDAVVIATFHLEVKYRPNADFMMRPSKHGGLVADAETDALYFFDVFSRLMKISPDDSISSSEKIVPRYVGSCPQANGIALSKKSRKIFTAIGNGVLGFPLDTRSPPPKCLDFRKQKDQLSTVCACSDQFLYFKDEKEVNLYRLKLSEDGKPLLPMSKFATGFSKIRAVTLDRAGKVLIADQDRDRVEVLSKKGTSLCMLAPESSAFKPTGVAVMELHSATGDQSPLVAVTDRYDDRIFLFSNSKSS